MTELELLEHQIDQAAMLIEFMLPFLDAKARESGDVAGIQANARNWLREPIVERARVRAVQREGQPQ